MLTPRSTRPHNVHTSVLERTLTDFLYAVGGAAGAVVAGRLAKADPTLQIAVIEHGQNNKDYPTVRRPSLFSALVSAELLTRLRLHLGARADTTLP